jgi:dipeptidyl aminopeptidase/acylaminoacyl peptidase
VKAAALFAPISASAKENFDRYTAERTDLAKQIEALYDTPESNPKFWKNISFENFFSKVSVPVLVHHGTSDESTPLRWSEAIVDNLKKNGKTVTFHVYPGEPHEFTGAWPTVMQRTTDFFKASL